MDFILVKTVFFGILDFGEIEFGIKMATVKFVLDLQKKIITLKEITCSLAMNQREFPVALSGHSVEVYRPEVQEFRKIL